MECMSKAKLRILVLVSIFILLAMIFHVFALYSKNSGLLVGQTMTQSHTNRHLKAAAVKPAKPSSLSNRVAIKRNSSYIVTLSYNSQMTRAIRNLMGQQCFARSMVGLSAAIVEPFSYESKLVHYKRFWDAMKTKDLHNAVLFEDYFDLNYYNDISIKEKSVPLLKWDDFMSRKRPKQNLVTVTLPSQRCNFESSLGAKSKSRQTKTCFIGKTLSALIEGLKNQFSVTNVKHICLECSELKHKLSMDELKKMIFGNDTDFSKYIVLTNTWRNFAFIESWLNIPSECRLAENPKSTRLKSSRSVSKHSTIYKKNFIKSKQTIAVMFRIERFLTLKVLGKSDETLQSCIDKTLKLHDKLKTEHSEAGTFITLDIGRFGSKLMMGNDTVSKYGQDSLQTIQKSVEKLIQDIYKGQFKSMEDYEDSFVKATGGITERGYISMVQRTIATEAECLVLMGGGSYQQVAISQYLELHPNKAEQCIHAVCVADNVSRMLE